MLPTLPFISKRVFVLDVVTVLFRSCDGSHDDGDDATHNAGHAVEVVDSGRVVDLHLVLQKRLRK